MNSITAGSTVMQGAAFNFSYVIENIGTQAAGRTMQLFVLMGSRLSGDHGWNSTDALGAGRPRLLSAVSTRRASASAIIRCRIAADLWAGVVESNETNNLRSVTFTVTAPPRADLVATASPLPDGGSGQRPRSLVCHQERWRSGAEAAGRASGSTPSQTAHARRGFGAIGSLGGGRHADLGGSIDTSHPSVGTHTLYVMADYWNNQVAEGDEGNNVRSVTFTVTAPPRCPTWWWPASTPAVDVGGAGRHPRLLVRGREHCRQPVGGGQSWAGFRIDSQPTANARRRLQASAIGCGGGRHADAERQHRHVQPQRRHHTLYVMADYWNNLVGEGNEANNVQVGDLHGDGAAAAGPRGSQHHAGGDVGDAGASLGFSFLIENPGDSRAVGPKLGGLLDRPAARTSGNTAGFNPDGGAGRRRHADAEQLASARRPSASASTRSTSWPTTGATWSARATRPTTGHHSASPTAPPGRTWIVSRHHDRASAAFDSGWGVAGDA